MDNANNYAKIPKEKFQFVQKSNIGHDKKLETKPVGYFQDAFRRFCKNKGAVAGGIVILFLLLFAIITPFCTPYTVDYYDSVFSTTQPKNNLFVNTNFWDGCKNKQTGLNNFIEDYAISLETGKPVIKNGEYTVNDEGIYEYRYDTYYGTGFGRYRTITTEEYNDIQRYQNETGRQVIYPTVKLSDRPEAIQDKTRANLYYKTKTVGGKTQPVLDENNNVIPNYWKYASADGLPAVAAEYNSLRIEGENGFIENGEQVFYIYGRMVSGGVEVRTYYYEYYRYYHTQVLKDGIDEPCFLFGTTSFGKDIFTCLSSGARFSFIFAIAVAVVNMFVGAIYGSVAGYFGGKIDLFMERFSDILGAVPTMIVITLLKLHMGQSSQALVLFIAFFLTGWIGMASTTRMQFYRFKNQEYVLAARTLGAKDSRLMFKHIFPNAIGTLVTSCALVIPSMIYSETNLSYLGIINLEAGKITSVGTMIAAGQRDMMIAPFVALFPSCFLALMMLSFNLFGNGLRDAFNPTLRGSEG
ncbi:MAG: ABC transporter permease [Candidatus Borkfalkiaceae bacterium]|nr:ABC transporter permease [Clostridia bacterium]MDY6223431.1 ABC transporter permease [Christensenellaceae bacterium]